MAIYTMSFLNFAVSGGFANVHPGNTLTINIVEGAPLESFSLEVRRSSCEYLTWLTSWFKAVRANLQEALRVSAGNGSEEDKLEARIEADVYEALQHALSSK